ncbi:MAG TPA: ribbon-helix-helix domain-containing protein [Methylomirabilota bacterium]|nr:ribbon-helix-helix domain-containing protein [Methylomirabilota bacterium]
MTTIAKKQSESLHARVPHALLEELDRIASGIGRSRNWVFNEAIKQYLDIQQWQTELIEQRLIESENSKAKFVAHNKIMKKYEKRLKAKIAL